MQLSYFSMMLVASGVSGGMSGASKLLHDYSSDGQGMAMTFSGASPTLRITDTTTPSNNWDSGLGTGYTVQDFFKSRSFTSYTGPVSSGKSLMQADGYIKPCRHNLLGMSQHIESAAWTVQNGSIVSKTAIAVPSVGSGTTAYALRATAGAGIQAAVHQNKTIVTNAPFTMSCYAYAGTTPYIALNVYVNSASYAIAVFDLSAGAGSATETFVGGTSGTIYSTAITDAGGGWYRCSITASVGSSSAYTFYQIAGAATGNIINAGQVRFAAGGTEDVYFWGLQFNNGYLLDYVSSEAHNLALQSADVTTSWTNVGSTDSGNTDTGPDGTTTADRVIETAASGRHCVYQAFGTAVVGLPVTYTARVKQGTRQYAFLQLSDNSLATYGVTFDLSNGAVGDVYTASSPTGTGYAVTALANGFYELSVTKTSGHATTYAVLALSDSLTPSAYTSDTPSYVGDGSSYIIVGNQQIELSSTPGKYVATTTTAVYNQHFDLPVEFNTNGTVKALTREEQRTNLCLRNTALATSPWATTLITPTNNSATAPDGTTTATLLTTLSTSGDCYQSITITAAAYTWSVYVKQTASNPSTYVYINAYDGSDHRSWFNLSTGAVGTNDTGNTSTITAITNSWYRITVTRTAGGTGGYFVLGLSDADNSLAVTSGNQVYAWGAQLEAGSTASSVIVTGSAAVTRAADVVTWSTKIMPSISTALSAYIYTTPDALSAGNKQLIDIYDSAKSDRIQMYYASTSTANTFTDGGVSQASLSGTMAAVHKGAFAAQANSFTVYENGSIAGGGEDTSGTMPDCSNGVHLGTNYLGSAVYGGKVHEILIVPSKLSAAQLDAITTA